MSQLATSEVRAQCVKNRETMIHEIRSLAGKLGRPPTRTEFFSRSIFNVNDVLKHFDGWNDAIEAAGLVGYVGNRRISDEQLLIAFGEGVREFKAIPKITQFLKFGRFHPTTIAARFGGWLRVPAHFRDYALEKPEWQDVLALFPQPATGVQIPGPVEQAKFGKPMDFPGYRYEPTEEIGVVYLFALLAEKLGFVVETLQQRFPDCIAKRQVSPDQFRHTRIEFEFESRNFRTQKHPVGGCDLIVCWRHNWPECPLEVIELEKVIKTRGKGLETRG